MKRLFGRQPYLGMDDYVLAALSAIRVTTGQAALPWRVDGYVICGAVLLCVLGLTITSDNAPTFSDIINAKVQLVDPKSSRMRRARPFGRLRINEHALPWIDDYVLCGWVGTMPSAWQALAGVRPRCRVQLGSRGEPSARGSIYLGFSHGHTAVQGIATACSEIL